MLELQDITAGYGDTIIVRNVEFQVGDGEIVGIIGKNGVGKTTLLKAIVGILTPKSGQIIFNNDEITTLPSSKRVRKGIGYVPQGRDVFSGLSVEENLIVGNSNNETQAVYNRVYEYFPILKERKDQDADTLSGGQQQMLAIGRALVRDPDLLVIDEPSEGIQPSIVQSITDDLTKINSDYDTTIVFVEQNLSVIQKLADRCYAMEQGKIVNKITNKQLDDTDRLAEYLIV